MNLVTFGLILLCCNVWAAKTNLASKFGNKMLEDFLKKFKTILKTGNETLGIPILDPFNADRLDIRLNEEKIKLDALLTKANVIGLSEYDIINADYTWSIKEVVLKLHLSWPLSIAASTNYSMNGKVDVFEIYGKGDIKMTAQKFTFDTEINFIMDGGITGHLKVKNMKLKLSLNSLDFHVTGLYDNDELSAVISAVISDMAPELISDDSIIKEVIPVISNQLDAFLSTMTVFELLKLILNF
ncbi:uncharacterized protein [Temnothorax nylanderi]|uniref:uncharacterized protein n=1 Tax=Temnothorax nylanderi TaxID=102681 RepID=UPI003A895D1C